MSADAGLPAGRPADVHHVLIDAASGRFAEHGTGAPVTSDLTIDEALLLQSVGWEAVELAVGASIWRLPYIGTMLGRPAGELPGSWEGFRDAVSAAARRLRADAHRAHADGIVGVEVGVEVSAGVVEVQLIGTAVRRVPATGRGHDRHPGMGGGGGDPFVSDLSARDFVLLMRAGWHPCGLAFGSSVVYAPRRSAGDTLRQSTQNIELTNLTTALYQARELAMERMQQSATAMRGHGVVAVTVREGPFASVRNAVQFTALGTAVVLVEEEHRQIQPRMVVPLDDGVVRFQVRSLR